MTLDQKLARIRQQAASGNIVPTFHIQDRMKKRGITNSDIAEAIASGEILEDYPSDPRGASCLINGVTQVGRPLHVVCTTDLADLTIISAYEPLPPKWITPRTRR